jgi:DNA-directed RNA polymerase subunit RPC12/RpoP
MAEPAMLKMSCASCGGQILFTKQQVGQTSKCPHCQNYIQFKSGGVSVEEFFGWIFFAGLCLMAAGIGFVVYYFHYLFTGITGGGRCQRRQNAPEFVRYYYRRRIGAGRNLFRLVCLCHLLHHGRIAAQLIKHLNPHFHEINIRRRCKKCRACFSWKARVATDGHQNNPRTWRGYYGQKAKLWQVFLH